MAFITDMITLVDSTTASYTQGAYQAVVSAHSTELHLVLVAYVALFGWGVMTARIEMSLNQAAKHILLMLLVFSLATRWDIFSVWFYDVFTTGPNKLISAVSNGSVNPQSQLSNVYDQGMRAGDDLFQAGGWRAVMPMILGGAVMVCTVLIVGYALFLIILAKLALAVLLAIAPLFIMFLLFNSTRNYFNSYLGQVMNYAMIPVLVYGILALALAIINMALRQFMSANLTQGALAVSSYVVLSEIIVFIILLQVTGMASALGGGLQLSSMSAVGTAYQKLWGGGGAQARRQKLGKKLDSVGRAAKDYVDKKMGRGKSMVGRR